MLDKSKSAIGKSLFKGRSVELNSNFDDMCLSSVHIKSHYKIQVKYSLF